MSWIVAVRLPKEKGGKLVILQENKEEATIAEFTTEAEANEAAGYNLLCQAFGYELIEIEVA